MTIKSRVVVFNGISALASAGLAHEMFHQRYQQYIIKRQWALPHRNELEVDVYDTDDAVYITILSDAGHILASVRMLPTSTNHLMEEVFSHLCERPIPQGMEVYEMTRYFVAPAIAKSRSVIRMSGEILGAMLEWAMENRIHTITSVIDDFFLPQMLEANWRPRILGNPSFYGGGPEVPGGGTCIAVAFEPDVSALHGLMAVRNMPIETASSTLSPDIHVGGLSEPSEIFIN